MTVLICKNIESEGPGTIGDFLGMKGIACRVVELPPAEGYGTLVMMGGPMSVNEGRLFPRITREIELAREFIARRKPVLGICVGAQSTVAGPGTSTSFSSTEQVKGLRDRWESRAGQLSFHLPIKEVRYEKGRRDHKAFQA